MRAYNDEIEHLNEVARNRPRAQLVLGKERCSLAKTMGLHYYVPKSTVEQVW